MTLRTSLLPLLESIRTIPDTLGLRRHRVWLVRRVHTGDLRLGNQTSTLELLSELTNGSSPPRVRQLSQRDLVASGGIYEAQDLTIGPLTPDHATGGTERADLDPLFTDNQEVFFKLTGPGLPEDGALFEKVGTRFDRAFSITFIVRRLP